MNLMHVVRGAHNAMHGFQVRHWVATFNTFGSEVICCILLKQECRSTSAVNYNALMVFQDFPNYFPGVFGIYFVSF